LRSIVLKKFVAYNVVVLQKLKKDLNRYKKRDVLRRSKARCSGASRPYFKPLYTGNGTHVFKKHLENHTGRCIDHKQSSSTTATQNDVSDCVQLSTESESIYGVPGLASSQVALITADAKSLDKLHPNSSCSEVLHSNKRKLSFGHVRNYGEKLVENLSFNNEKLSNEDCKLISEQDTLSKLQISHHRPRPHTYRPTSKHVPPNCLKNSCLILPTLTDDKKSFKRKQSKSIFEVYSLPETDNNDFRITTPLLDQNRLQNLKTNSVPLILQTSQRLSCGRLRNPQLLDHQADCLETDSFNNQANSMFHQRNTVPSVSPSHQNHCAGKIRPNTIKPGYDNRLIDKQNPLRHTLITRL